MMSWFGITVEKHQQGCYPRTNKWMSQFNKPGLASEVVDSEWVPKMYKEKRGE